MNFSEVIKEDAALYYAKFSYDIENNYKCIPEVLIQILEDYLHTSGRVEIEALLVDSYITSKNYKKALELMEQSHSFDNPEVYQKVAFYRGLELFEEEDYKGAKEAFEKALSKTPSEKIKARSTFWKAESDYNLENFSR